MGEPKCRIKVALIGPPGSGKGTQAARLSASTGIAHVSSGDVLRKQVRDGTALGLEIRRFMDRGEIGPVELITEAILDFLDARCRDGFVLDGFPRTVYQAEKLAERHRLDAALLIAVPAEAIIDRITGRRICPACNRVFHVQTDPPSRPGVCDGCGQALIARSDDNAETVANRLRVYDADTRPVLDYYGATGQLRTIDGTLSPERVFEQLRARLGLA